MTEQLFLKILFFWSKNLFGELILKNLCDKLLIVLHLYLCAVYFFTADASFEWDMATTILANL